MANQPKPAEVMPLITYRSYDKEDGHYIDTKAGTAEEQLAADLLILEAQKQDAAGQLQKILDTNSVYFSHDGVKTLRDFITALRGGE